MLIHAKHHANKSPDRNTFHKRRQKGFGLYQNTFRMGGLRSIFLTANLIIAGTAHYAAPVLYNLLNILNIRRDILRRNAGVFRLA